MLLLIIPRNKNNTQKIVWCKYYQNFFFLWWTKMYTELKIYVHIIATNEERKRLLQVSSSIPDDFYYITLLMLLYKHYIYIHFYILLWRLLRNLTWDPFSIIQILNLIGIYHKWLTFVSWNPWTTISNMLSTVCLLSFVKYSGFINCPLILENGLELKLCCGETQWDWCKGFKTRVT